MVKDNLKIKNSFDSNDLILKGMFKRRRLAIAMLSTVSDEKKNLKLIK